MKENENYTIDDDRIPNEKGIKQKVKIVERKGKNIIKKIAIIIGLLSFIFVVSTLFLKFPTFNNKPEVSTEYLYTVLSEASELTTSELNYTGMSEYKDGGIPIFNKADFKMTYKAKARAGIDIEKVEVEVNNDKKIVYLTIPKAKVLDVKVDPKTIKYFDEKFTLLNVNPKEDANKAQELVEEEAKKEVEKMGILETADKQAETLIIGLLQGSVTDYEFKVIKK